MTERLYYQNPYEVRFHAVVLSCETGRDGYYIILDRTLFYPEGGGQPADIGTLGGVHVWDVHEKNGDIVHYTDAPLTLGSQVMGEIDWAHRFDLMQNHSGEHILSGVICKQFGCDNVGFHMGRDRLTIDLNTKIPEEKLAALEEKANEAIWRNIPIDIAYPPAETLAHMEYRSKIALEGEVRIVTAGEYDCCACCGTHVRYAGEIGMIKIVGVQNYKGGTRLELLCGRRALRHYQEKNTAADEAGKMLSVPGEKIDEAVLRLQQERDTLLQDLTRWKWECFQQRVAATPDNVENVLVLEDGLKGKDMTSLGDLYAEKTNGRVMVLTPVAGEFAFVLLSRKGDAQTIANALKQKFQLKGGGKPDMMQGKLVGEKKEILNFFLEQGFYYPA